MYKLILILLLAGCTTITQQSNTENMYDKLQRCAKSKSGNEMVLIDGQIEIRHNEEKIDRDCK